MTPASTAAPAATRFDSDALCRHAEDLSLLSRAANRQMRVYEGTHKPYSATRGKGFSTGTN